eukprot:CAMPEP_0185577228 /NCGR_PEP_ID=MMETSP0434-20130131/9303_1 /TAXON_ID=626734 ORGANISM="Favella taraikaensis, Strain Fe Narragansett Bay" /NCGR_SAMPLE_ID=MMETSP0434 /ASSEMBLY_ACC=CAM_ASM_000379 /LENGTH=138 /DNA_ID=CAMNT_0028194729 /DNA_START=23 /DNA_END=439 /DNA_ORIENTATION=+
MADQENPKLDAIRDWTMTVAQRHQEHYLSLSAEQKAVNDAFMADVPARVAEFEVVYAAADANGDGILDKAEMRAYLNKDYETKTAAGMFMRNPADLPEEMFDTFYEKMNSISEGEGVSKQDWFSWGAQFGKILTEMRQ